MAAVLLLGAASHLGRPLCAQENSFRRQVIQFQADRQSLEDFYDLAWSPARWRRLKKFDQRAQEWLGRADFDALSKAGQIDFLLLAAQLRRDQAWMEWRERRLDEVKDLLPFRQPLENLEQSRWHLAPVNLPADADLLSQIPGQLARVRQKIESGRKKEANAAARKVSPAEALRAAEIASRCRALMENWFRFYDAFMPDFAWWIRKPFDQASAALADYAKYLREEIAGQKGKPDDPLVGDPIGPQMLDQEIKAEWIDYTPAELIEIGQRELAWCQAELKKASAKMGCGDDWKKALARVKADYVPPGEQDSFVAAKANEAIEFVRNHNLVDIPPLCAETWRVSMISAEGQRTLPYAAYSHQQIMVAYASSDMSQEDKIMSMRGNNRHFTRIVAAHELIPGHHLQLFEAARHRPYRALFRTPFFVEGWSVYWELRLWDLGYGQTPEDQIGMLFWRMHRAARIIVSLKFHLGQMTPEQMVDFLADQVGHERFGARSEVRRYIGGAYSPLYQCGYLIGGLQLKALRDAAVGSGRFDEKTFHDAVLHENAIPIELIRADLLQIPLTRQATARWRFYSLPLGKQP